MKAQFKIDTETWLISSQTKYPMYFEGQTENDLGAHLYIKFIPISTTRPAINCEQTRFILRFHIYSDNMLTNDKIFDELSSLVSERNLNGIEFGTLTYHQRGNRFGDSWEHIADCSAFHWHDPSAIVESLT